MGTSTNILQRCFFSLVLVVSLFSMASASTTIVDSCEANIVVEYDSLQSTALLTVTHSGTPNSTIQWQDGSPMQQIAVSATGAYCVTVTTETQCVITTCAEVDLGPIDSCIVTVFSYPDTIFGGAYVSADPSGVGPFTYLWSTGAIANNIDIDSSANYCVTVTDANGCESTGCKFVEASDANHIVSFTVPADVVLFLDASCNVDTSLSVTGIPSNEYVTCENGYQTSYSDQIVAHCPGSYNLTRIWTLTDNCGNAVDKTQNISVYDTLAPVFTVPSDVTLFLDPTTCLVDTTPSNTGDVDDEFDNCSASANATYSDVWSISGLSNCQNDGTLTRTWTLVDDCGNTRDGIQIITVLDTTQSNQPDSCFFDVVIFEQARTPFVVALGADPAGVAPFTYLWSDGSTVEILDALQEGPYCLTITDANGCEGYNCYTVEFEAAPVDTCSTWIEVFAQDGDSIKIWGHTTGVGPFSHTWSTGNTATSETGEAFINVTESGAYCITVVDVNQCESQHCVDVVITDAPVDSCYSWITKTADGPNRYELAVESQGVGPFTIIWHDSLYQDGDYLYVEQSGYYCATVYDANQCASDACIQIDIDPVTPDSCATWIEILPQDDGTVKIWGHSTGVGPFSHTWSTGNTAISQSGEAFTYVSESGEYCITVLDANQCESSHCVTVTVPDTEPVDSCTVDINIYEVERSAGLVKLGIETTDSTVLSSATWSDGSAGPYLYAQQDGNYCVTATDENGCEGYFCYTVELESQVDSCGVWIEQIAQADGSVKLWAHGVGGTGSYAYTWPHDQTITEPYFYASESGNYCVVVYDTDQCQSETCVYVELVNNTQDSCYSSIVKTADGPNRYELSVEANGEAPFTIVWHDSLYQDGDYLYVEQSGTYCATVYDANQCVSEACVEVEIDSTTDSCYFDLVIFEEARTSDLVALGADPSGDFPFTYVWSDGSTGSILDVQSEGQYCLTVTDGNGCEGYECYYVEFEAPAVDSCATWIEILPQDDGTVKIWGHSTGVGPFSHTWSTGNTAISQSGEAFTYVSESGEYCITVIDANQCESQHCVDVVVDTAEPTDSCYSWITKTADGQNRYELAVETQGEGPFTIIWHDSLYQDGDYLYVEQSGIYCVNVNYANQCVSEACIEIEIADITCSLDIITSSSSTDTLTILEGDTDGEEVISYIWSTGDSTYKVPVLESGEYCLTITTVSGCSKSACIYIDPDSTVCNTEINFSQNSTAYEAVLEADPAGVGPFTFYWSDGSTSSTLVARETGTYCVVVTDATGCVSEQCKEVEVTEPVCTSYLQIWETMDDAVTIGVETDGVAPFEYYWSNGENSQEITVSVSKEYCVEVIDALGCISFDCKYIEVEDYSSCSVEIEVTANADSTEYKVSANPSGTAPFTYDWAHGDTSRYFYPTLDGYFCVTVTDAEGCVSETCFKTEGITPSVELEVFPNPSKGDFFVEIDSELEFLGLIEIRDIQGNLLFTTWVDISQGVQGLNFSSDEYPNGVFFVNIIRGSHVESIRVVKAGN